MVATPKKLERTVLFFRTWDAYRKRCRTPVVGYFTISQTSCTPIHCTLLVFSQKQRQSHQNKSSAVAARVVSLHCPHSRDMISRSSLPLLYENNRTQDECLCSCSYHCLIGFNPVQCCGTLSCTTLSTAIYLITVMRSTLCFTLLYRKVWVYTWIYRSRFAVSVLLS